jgi:hypothetical protein
VDAFTLQRLKKFVIEHRASSGTLPTLADLERAGFPKTLVDAAKKKKLIEELYVTLTNGSIVKGFKAKG